MSSLTTWNRLESVPRQDDMTPSLRATIADPFWLLARQWQFGELSGEDAGSPIESVLNVETATVDRFHAGEITTNAADQSVDLSAPHVPLEAMVEAQPVAGREADVRLRIDAGQHFVRLLRASGGANLAARYRDHYPMPNIQETDRPLVMAGVARRVPDGRAVAEDLLAHRGNDSELTSLPAEPRIPARFEVRVRRAANAFLEWWQEHHLGDDVFAGESWNSRRLEHACAVGTHLRDGQLVLRADEYPGGHLDWCDFDVDSRANLGGSNSADAPRTLVRRTLPTRAFYAGMPAERFWEFEDSTVRFGVGSVGRGDLAHLLLNEFALTYGNDWYVVPLKLPTGSVSAVRRLVVRDTFGIETTVGQSSSIGSSNWGMFHLTPHPRSARRVRDLFFLPTSLGPAPQGDSIEEVAWFRDEMANMVWAVEHQLERPIGGSQPASEHYRSRVPVVSQTIAGEIDDAELIYRLNSWVPEQWFPLVPVRPSGAQAGVVELQLRPMTRVDADGSSRVTTPSAHILSTADPLVIEEEEVPRDGVTTRAHWQITRTSGGHYRLWLSHRVTSGAGEGSSGLVFDISRSVK